MPRRKSRVRARENQHCEYTSEDGYCCTSVRSGVVNCVAHEKGKPDMREKIRRDWVITGEPPALDDYSWTQVEWYVSPYSRNISAWSDAVSSSSSSLSSSAPKHTAPAAATAAAKPSAAAPPTAAAAAKVPQPKPAPQPATAAAATPQANPTPPKAAAPAVAAAKAAPAAPKPPVAAPATPQAAVATAAAAAVATPAQGSQIQPAASPVVSAAAPQVATPQQPAAATKAPQPPVATAASNAAQASTPIAANPVVQAPVPIQPTPQPAPAPAQASAPALVQAPAPTPAHAPTPVQAASVVQPLPTPAAPQAAPVAQPPAQAAAAAAVQTPPAQKATKSQPMPAAPTPAQSPASAQGASPVAADAASQGAASLIASVAAGGSAVVGNAIGGLPPYASDSSEIKFGGVSNRIDDVFTILGAGNLTEEAITVNGAHDAHAYREFIRKNYFKNDVDMFVTIDGKEYRHRVGTQNVMRCGDLIGKMTPYEYTKMLIDTVANYPSMKAGVKFNIVLGNKSHGTNRKNNIWFLQNSPENAGALFQVASNFNSLEQTAPDEIPGMISMYWYDTTQGPMAALCTAPATLWRRYVMNQVNPSPAPDDENNDAYKGYLGIFVENSLTLTDPHGKPYSSYKNLTTTIGGWLDCRKLDVNVSGIDLRYDKYGAVAGFGCFYVNNCDSVITYDDQTGKLHHNKPNTISQVYTAAVDMSKGSLDTYGAPAPIPDDSTSPQEVMQYSALMAAYCNTLLVAKKNNHKKVFLTLVGGGVFKNPRAIIFFCMVIAMIMLRRICEREKSDFYKDVEVNLIIYNKNEEAMNDGTNSISWEPFVKGYGYNGAYKTCLEGTTTFEDDN